MGEEEAAEAGITGPPPSYSFSEDVQQLLLARFADSSDSDSDSGNGGVVVVVPPTSASTPTQAASGDPTPTSRAQHRVVPLLDVRPAAPSASARASGTHQHSTATPTASPSSDTFSWRSYDPDAIGGAYSPKVAVKAKAKANVKAKARTAGDAVRSTEESDDEEDEEDADAEGEGEDGGEAAETTTRYMTASAHSELIRNPNSSAAAAFPSAPAHRDVNGTHDQGRSPSPHEQAQAQSALQPQHRADSPERAQHLQPAQLSLPSHSLISKHKKALLKPSGELGLGLGPERDGDEHGHYHEDAAYFAPGGGFLAQTARDIGDAARGARARARRGALGVRDALGALLPVAIDIAKADRRAEAAQEKQDGQQAVRAAGTKVEGQESSKMALGLGRAQTQKQKYPPLPPPPADLRICGYDGSVRRRGSAPSAAGELGHAEKDAAAQAPAPPAPTRAEGEGDTLQVLVDARGGTSPALSPSEHGVSSPSEDEPLQPAHEQHAIQADEDGAAADGNGSREAANASSINFLTYYSIVVAGASAAGFQYENALIGPLAALPSFVLRFQAGVSDPDMLAQMAGTATAIVNAGTAGTNTTDTTASAAGGAAASSSTAAIPSTVLTAVNQNLIFAIPLLGSIIGAVAATPLQNRLGRKGALLFSYAFSLPPLFLELFAPNLAAFVLARWWNGLAYGVALAAGPLYLADLVPARMRGRAVTSMNILTIAASVLATVTVWATEQREQGTAEYRIPLAVQCAIPVLLFLATLPLPESPVWLTSKGIEEMEQAERRPSLLPPQVIGPTPASTPGAKEQAEQSAAAAAVVAPGESYVMQEFIRGGEHWPVPLRKAFRSLALLRAPAARKTSAQAPLAAARDAADAAAAPTDGTPHRRIYVELAEIVAAEEQRRTVEARVRFWDIFRKDELERTMVSSLIFSLNQVSGVIVSGCLT